MRLNLFLLATFCSLCTLTAQDSSRRQIKVYQCVDRAGNITLYPCRKLQLMELITLDDAGNHVEILSYGRQKLGNCNRKGKLYPKKLDTKTLQKFNENGQPVEQWTLDCKGKKCLDTVFFTSIAYQNGRMCEYTIFRYQNQVPIEHERMLYPDSFIFSSGGFQTDTTWFNKRGEKALTKKYVQDKYVGRTTYSYTDTRHVSYHHGRSGSPPDSTVSLYLPQSGLILSSAHYRKGQQVRESIHNYDEQGRLGSVRESGYGFLRKHLIYVYEY